MKNYLLILSLVSILFSCNKPDNNDETVEDSSFRISKATLYDKGLENELIEYHYVGDKLSELIGSIKAYDSTGFTNWYKISFEYELPKVVAVLSLNYSGEWQEFDRLEYQIIDGKMTAKTEFEYQDGSLEKKYLSAYSFINGQLNTYTKEGYYDKEVKQVHRREYFYENDKLMLCNIYELNDGNLFLHRFESYTYRADEFDVDTYRVSDSLHWSKQLNALVNGKIMHREHYADNMYNELEYIGVENYLYNADGLLSETHLLIDNDDELIKIVYEKGRGNIAWFYAPEEELAHQTPVPQKNISSKFVGGFFLNLDKH
ncbi:MAG: hypothetical protein GQ527_13390 [Bacteroidales bacterium]|nr:hypothetical protein [Bacteroidales bacterium]